MELEAAKMIGAGLAAIALAGAGVGIGLIFGNYLSGAMRNPSAVPIRPRICSHHIFRALAVPSVPANAAREPPWRKSPAHAPSQNDRRSPPRAKCAAQPDILLDPANLIVGLRSLPLQTQSSGHLPPATGAFQTVRALIRSRLHFADENALETARTGHAQHESHHALRQCRLCAESRSARRVPAHPPQHPIP